MLFEAPHDGHCRGCDKPIARGTRIAWQKGWEYTLHEACSDEGRARAAGLAASYAHDSDLVIPAPEGLSYLPFQRAGIAFALSRPEGIGCIFGDDMGLGKTCQALGVVNASPDVRTVLVVCPSSLKFNWRNEAERWLVKEKEIQVDPEPFWQTSLETTPPILRIQIINYEQFDKALTPSSAYDIVIFDEAHYIKNPDSIRGKFARRAARRAKRVLCLSGTPIPNHVIDIFPLLQVCDPATWDPPGMVKGAQVAQGFGAGLFPFAKRYCNARKIQYGRGPGTKKFWDMTGSSNLDELHDRLRSTIMVRRLKTDVLPELPDKRRQILALPPSARDVALLEKERGLWSQISPDALDVYDDWEEGVKKLSKQRGVLFEEISHAKKEVGLAKVPYVAEYVRACLDEGLEMGTKIILFAHHEEVLDLLLEELRDYLPCVIRGYSDDAQRELAVKNFQEDTDRRLFLGSIGAAGVGLTLTASSHVVFAEESWSHKDVSQCEDRAHRIGQKKSVLVTHIVFDGSMDANMMKKVLKKQEAAERALGG